MFVAEILTRPAAEPDSRWGISGEEAKMPNDIEKQFPEQVPGPDGKVLTRADLPPPDECRWGPRKKARVVAAVESGLLSFNEARRLYRLSVDEFVGWQRALHAHGVQGLRALSGRLSRQAKRLRKKGGASPAPHPAPKRAATAGGRHG